MAARNFLALIFFISSSIGVFAQTTPATPSTPAASATAQTPSTNPSGIINKDLEVAMGIDAIENLDFEFSTIITIGNDQLLKILPFSRKKQLVFKGLKPGRTSVTIRDNSGDVRMIYTVVVTATGKSNEVAELRELIGDVEGLEIGIRGGKVIVSGEIVVPDDIGRVSKVLANYPSVLTLIELSPQTQRVIARKMIDELAASSLRDVTVRVVNKTFWLEGVVSNEKKKELAQTIAEAYLPPKLQSLASGEGRFATPDKADILNFIAVNEKKEPQPAPKMVKVTAQFVELSKNYSKVFAFKWAPLMGEDQSRISIGPTASGNVSSTSSGTLSATISNLFPKLNSAKAAGYARVINSGMVITRDQQEGTIEKEQTIPFSLGAGEQQKATSASVGLKLVVKSQILEQEKIQLGFNLSVSLGIPGSSPPETIRNALNTNVVLKSKESAALGGIVQNQSSTNFDRPNDDPAPVTGTPPPSALFRLFRSKNYNTAKSQYVIFVTPEIIESASVGTEEIRRKFRRRE